MDKKYVRIFTDGACRGNPGHGGAGVVLMDGESRIVGTARRYLGQCTNNIAEYQALIIGLEEASKRGFNHLHIQLDSELLAKQINGSYRVKNPNLKNLMTEVRNLLATFESYRVEHIKRSGNTLADRLANEAIDEALQ